MENDRSRAQPLQVMASFNFIIIVIIITITITITIIVWYRFSLIQGAECRTGESEQEQLGDVVHIFRQPKDKFTGTCLSDTNLQILFYLTQIYRYFFKWHKFINFDTKLLEGCKISRPLLLINILYVYIINTNSDNQLICKNNRFTPPLCTDVSVQIYTDLLILL